MDWKLLTNEEELEQIKKRSNETPQVIFKHSTRCSLSSMAKSRLERATAPAAVEFHFLDLLRYRSLSNKIEADFLVSHESPQILLIKNGQCVYDDSHSGISMDDIHEESAR